MFKKVLTFFAALGVFMVPAFVFATTTPEYQTLSELPGVQGSTASIGTFVNALFRMAIGLGAIIAVLMIVIGGFEYLSTDLFQRKSDAKTRIQNSLLGLGLLLISTLLLETINPKLLDLSYEPIEARIEIHTLDDAGVYTNTRHCIGETNMTARGGPYLPTMGQCYATEEECVAARTARQAEVANNISVSCAEQEMVVEFDGCTDCVPAEQICQNFNANPCQTGGGERACMVSPTLGDPLRLVGTATRRQVTCTEVWPPVANHADPCHDNGSCLDFRISESGTIPPAADIMRTIQAFENSGACAVFEVSTSAARNSILAQGRQLRGTPGFDYALFERRVQTVAGVSPHFSGYATPNLPDGRVRNHCRD